jgi:hypothetical protein
MVPLPQTVPLAHYFFKFWKEQKIAAESNE